MKMQDKDYCPRVVEGIEFTTLFQNKSGITYSMGSRLCDRYIQIGEANKEAIELVVRQMQGEKNISDIQEYMKREHHVKLNVTELCEWLGKAGLLVNPPEEVSIEKQEMDYLAVTIKKWKLDKFCNVFSFLSEKHGREIFIGSILLIFAGMITTLLHWREFITLKNYEVNGSLYLGFAFMVIIFVISIGCHELGHALMGYRFGLKPKELVFALYVGTPMFYVKIPGIYTLEPKKRVYVWSVGVYVNLVLAAICTIWMQLCTGDLRNLVMIGVTTNLSLVIANLSPLLPLDGYFILSTLLQKPNLRKGSFQQFKKWFLRRENRFEGLYIVYFLASVSFYGAVVICEARKVVSIISHGIACNYDIIDYLYEFRLVGIILSIIVLKKIVDVLASYICDHKKEKTYAAG